MYEDEEDEQVVKVKIPKYKIIYSDLEGPKKESEVLNTNERVNTNSNEKKEEVKVNLQERILERNNFFNLNKQ